MGPISDREYENLVAGDEAIVMLRRSCFKVVKPTQANEEVFLVDLPHESTDSLGHARQANTNGRFVAAIENGKDRIPAARRFVSPESRVLRHIPK